MSDEKRDQQGFTVSDRRKHFEEEPAPARPDPPGPPAAEKSPASPEGGRPPEEAGGGPQEPAHPDFAHLISRLAQEALFFMGVIPDPATGQPERNLGAASWTIDTLDLLRAKTAGNLDEVETRMLENYLAELRVQFLSASGFLKKESSPVSSIR